MNELVKNAVAEAEIHGYSSEGEGVARIGGLVIFVKNVLDGEKCRIRILKVNKNVAWGRVEEVLVPSPHRVAPACPVFGKCGGCSQMHMDYEEELRFKRQKVDDALQRIGGLSFGTEEILPSPHMTGYRNKAIYAVGYDDAGRAITGFFRRHSHDVVAAPGCLIQSDSSHRAAGAVRAWMDRFSVPAYEEKTGRGLVRHVFCRSAGETGKVQVTLVCNGERLPHREELIEEILKECPETDGILLNCNTTRGNTVLAGSMETLWGKGELEDTLCGLRFRLSPFSFYQVNREQAEHLYGRALEYAGLTGKETVLDLYCGTGTITLCLARNAKKVYGVEIVAEAIRDAKENARRNGIDNAEFFCADSAEAAGMFRKQGIQPDVVVVDPPRKGLDPAVIGHIAFMAPEKVVYVSCDCATLARDVKLFSEKGYACRRAAAADMFPKTSHVETVVLLSKR